MMEYAFYHCKGPVAIRYPRGCEKKISEEHDTIEYDSNSISPVLLNSGNDLTIIAEGVMVEKGYKVCLELEKLGHSCDLIDIRIIKPLKHKAIIDSLSKTGKVIVLENAIIKGGLGSAVEELIIEENIHAELIKVGVGDHILCQGKIDQLFIQEGMDVESILEKAKLMISSK
jgi:transketolase C-terminal domain/subunit